MKFRIDIELPAFDYDRIEDHKLDESWPECEHCGKGHDPEGQCINEEMIRTGPIPELVKGTHAKLKKLLTRKGKKKDK